MKITSGKNLSGFGKHQRVIGRAAGFSFHYLPRVTERAADCAMNLWHATHGICILHARIVFQMRLAYLTVAQKLSQVRGHFDLSGVWPRGVYAFIEGDRRPA